MASFQKVGNFQLNDSAGNQSISGLGFQPKAILFFHNPDTVTTEPSVANNYGMIGMADGTTQAAVWWFGINGSGTESSDQMQTTSFCIFGGQNSSNIYGASFVSFDSDGFTINVENPDITPPDTFMVGYWAIGGDDVSAKVGSALLNTSTGAQAVTGVGFQPTGLVGMTVGSTTALYSSGNSNGGTICQPSLGFSDGTNDACIGGWLRDSGVTVTVRARVVRDDSWLATISGSSSYNFRVSITSLDADGFTMNIDDAGSAARIFYLALGGVSIQAGTFTHDVDVGTYTAIDSLPFQPRSIITATDWSTVANTINGGGAGGAHVYNIGFADADDSAFSIGGVDLDNTSTSDADHWSNANSCLTNHNFSRDLVQEASAAEFNSDNITFTTVEGTGGDRVVAYLTVEGDTFDEGGDNPGSGSGGDNSPDASFLFGWL